MSTCPTVPPVSRSTTKWKIKNGPLRLCNHLSRSLISARNDPEGSGGTDGIVLPMDIVYYGKYSVSYTIPLKFGSNAQTLSLQVDTGSSDLWVASTSCSTSTCKQAGGALYDGKSASSSDSTLNISYIAGSATGPIVWDQVNLGGYEIDNQALAAANDVEAEPLNVFSGVLGLALPANSLISRQIPPGTGNAADGAVFASNLFTMGISAPAAYFLSLSLERPGSTKIPSMFGIGRHPSEVVSDPSSVSYSRIVTGGDSPLFWKTTVSEIVVWVDGIRKTVAFGPTVSGSVLPTAVLDSGVPVILTTTAIANGIYGALGIGPAPDGSYFVPCKTPLNMTITVNDLLIPLHPLDMTQSDDQASDSCTGLIQASDNDLIASQIGDMILGVPFMRNIYTVMAYIPPSSNGTFDRLKSSQQSVDPDMDPRLGMLNLTDPTIAMEEFNTVRVLGQPLSPGSSGSSGSSPSATSHHELSIGLKVFIGLISGFTLLVAVFLGRFLYQRRSWNRDYRKANNTNLDVGKDEPELLVVEDVGARRPFSKEGHTNARLREMQFEEYTRRKGIQTGYTIDSARTRVEEDDEEDEMKMDEFGLVYFTRKGHGRNSSSGSFGWRDTLVNDNDDAGRKPTPSTRGSTATQPPDDPDLHHGLPGSRPPTPDTPLISNVQNRNEWTDPSPTARSPGADEDGFGLDGGGNRESMAGVGTRNRGRLASDEFSTAAISQLAGHMSWSPPPILHPPRSVKPKGPRRHTMSQISDPPDPGDAHERHSFLANS